MADGVDLANLQGNVLTGYGYPQAAYLFCQVDDAVAARRWLGDLLPGVTSAAPWTQKPARTLNIAFSFAGLRTLGLPEADLATLPAEFRVGMAARAGRLRDEGADAPEHWQEGLDDRTAHVLVTVHVLEGDPSALDGAVAAVRPGAGVRVLADERTAVPADGREHFGYADGFSQPSIADAVAGPYHGQGTPPPRHRRRRTRVQGWGRVAPGEFVLGYPDEDQVVATAPAPLDRDATFMVVRKLEQHVAAWERQLLRWADGDARLAERLGAQVVGRWKNGTPVASFPDEAHELLDIPGPLTRAQRLERFRLLNDFRFADDPDGTRCPRGAHVRRANPRDAFGDGRMTRRHRLLRRGMPYGPAPTDAERSDDTGSPERGLLFVCFQASIARQFELVQADWLTDGDAFGLGGHRDTLMCPGAPDGLMRVNDAGKPLLTGHSRTVTLRGGGYFVVPSLAALAAIAARPTR